MELKESDLDTLDIVDDGANARGDVDTGAGAETEASVETGDGADARDDVEMGAGTETEAVVETGDGV